jgi:hypothetical protein
MSIKPIHALIVACASLFACAAISADDVQPKDFAWRATLTLPAGASVARVDVPVDALLRLQTSAASDVRVFNATGAVVPFAVLGNSDLQRATAVTQTNSYPAHVLYAADASKNVATKAGRDAVQVQVSTASGKGGAWVRWDSAAGAVPVAGATVLPAALFDTRGDTATWSAVQVQGELPRNALVHMTVETSANLKDWAAVPVKGPLFHFDGTDAPSSKVLEFQQAISVKGRYLRLSWEGSEGVTVTALTGQVASTRTSPPPLRADLGNGALQDNGLQWRLGFATPIAALHLQATQNNSLIPVRIQSRVDASQPWLMLASTVVYRIDAQGATGRNAATALGGATVRQLRVEPSNAAQLADGAFQATVEFAPVQIAFLASGPGPYTLAVGRAQTGPAAVDASLLGSVLGGAQGAGSAANAAEKWAALPAASIGDVQATAQDAAGQAAGDDWAARLTSRSAMLWAVLVLGVLVLGGVAYSLLKQLKDRGTPNNP